MNPRHFMGHAGHGPHGHGPRGPRHGMGMGWGGRMRRGAMRYILMDTLKAGPKHGYEIIKALEERSNGEYVPSPGIIYPTLQFLEDAGLVEAEQQEDRRVFRLTERGLEELASRAKEVEAFWARLDSPLASSKGQAEIGFLMEELASLERTVWSGLRGAVESNDLAMVRRVRTLVEQCRNQVRDAVTEV